MSTEKVLFTVNGFEVKANSIYKVKDKPDGDAPTGFQELGVTKLPSAGVDESFQVPFHQLGNNGGGIWNTGFNEHSPCYYDMDPVVVTAQVKALNANLLKPYRAATGNQEAFKEGNEDFFKRTNFQVYSGQVFNTNNVIDLMTLYFALRAHQVAPEGRQGDSKYREASYIIVDKNKDVKEKDRRKSLKFSAIGTFTSLYQNDRERLYAILGWSGLPVSESVDQMTLVSMFDEFIEGKPDRAEFFLNTEKDSNTKIGLEKILIYRKLKDTISKNTRISKVPNGSYFYDGNTKRFI
jgi:hypothetical protein